MLILLLKSFACLAVFIAFYKLCLERENMHQFKRFYLLAALVVSFIIPFITFIKYVEPTLDFGTTDMFGNMPPYFPAETPIIEQPVNYLPIILWSIYGLGILLFGVKFSLNLVRIILKIKNNEQQKQGDFITVLLKDIIAPHTFFSYIFLNKTKYVTKAIPQEVLLHEATHAIQKHSLDVLFIELLQVVFWFNPLLYIIKRDIKLNHEFLADEAVLKHGIDSSTYQNTLLAFSTSAAEPELANAINYSLIKKRFTIMKTQTSKKTAWFRCLLLLPLLGILLFSFSNTKEVVKETQPFLEVSETPQELLDSEKQKHKENNPLIDVKSELQKLDHLKVNYSKKSVVVSEELKISIVDKNTIYVNNKLTDLYNFKATLLNFNKSLSKKEIKKAQKVDLIVNTNTESETVNIVKNVLRKEGYYKLNLMSKINNQKPTLIINGIFCNGCKLNLSKKGVQNMILATTTSDDVIGFKIKIPGNPTQNSTDGKLNAKAISFINKSSMGDTIQLFDIITETKQKLPAVTITLVDKNAKNYSHSPIVKKGEKSSLPLPPKPPMPPAPKYAIPPPIPENATKEERKKMQAAIDTFEEKYKRKVHTLKTEATGEAVSFIVNDQEYTKFSTTKNSNNFTNVNPPPSPPKPPKSAYHYVLNLKNKQISYFYNGTAISYKEALNITQKERNINMSTLITNNEGTVHFESIKPNIETLTNEINTTNITLDADTLEELKTFDWEALPIIFENNNPEKIITLSFNLNKKVRLGDTEVDSFNLKLSDKASELNKMIKKAKKMINKLSSI